MAADSAAKAAGIYVIVRIEHKRGIETVVSTLPRRPLPRWTIQLPLADNLCFSEFLF
jgi:hypothetical protein